MLPGPTDENTSIMEKPQLFELRFGWPQRSKRAANLLTAAAITMGAVMTVGSGTASAAVPENVRFYDSGKMSDGSRIVEVFVNGAFAGLGQWKADGDTLEALDRRSDGFGIASYLSTSPVREASTYGHDSPYTATKGET